MAPVLTTSQIQKAKAARRTNMRSGSQRGTSARPEMSDRELARMCERATKAYILFPLRAQILLRIHLTRRYMRLFDDSVPAKISIDASTGLARGLAAAAAPHLAGGAGAAGAGGGAA